MDTRVVTTKDLGNSRAQIDPCNHEEADTRMGLHVAHRVQAGHRYVYV